MKLNHELNLLVAAPTQEGVLEVLKDLHALAREGDIDSSFYLSWNSQLVGADLPDSEWAQLRLSVGSLNVVPSTKTILDAVIEQIPAIRNLVSWGVMTTEWNIILKWEWTN